MAASSLPSATTWSRTATTAAPPERTAPTR
uniref:Uncharacterized protein n=1 Tax=Arundo donax TaxID=35708 RepID=A0A0A9HK47_ARUDO